MTLTTPAEAPTTDAKGLAPRRLPRPRGMRFNLRGLAFAIGLLVVLEALTTWVVHSSYVPRPSGVFVALYDQIVGGGNLLDGVLNTLQTWALGLGLAAVLGVTLGVILGASAPAFNAVKMVIEFLRPLPSVALIPFAILILGVGGPASVTITAYASFWPILFNTYYGVRDADPVAIDTARNFGLSRPAVLRRVLLPNAATNIATGVRISAAIALILAITVEIITSSGGLGYFIVRMQTAIRIEDMYAGVFAVGVLGYVINLVFTTLERKLVFWKTDARDGSAS